MAAATAERHGRALLRLPEHGAGPTIDIAWPAERAERERPYAQLERCFGMEVAIMDRTGRLFLASGTPGRAGTIDPDRYSGFLRSPMGHPIRVEALRLAAIARRHPGAASGGAVRLFPRAVDARLLGGLAAMLGEDHRGARHVTARYRQGGDAVVVEAIQVDGAPVAGRVVPSAAGRRP